MITEDALWQTIDKVIEPFEGYREALERLSALPRGYALCFAFNYFDADISNGGISQLHANSTWSLVLAAVEACREAKTSELERLLREVVLYYCQRGRSRLKKQLSEEFFTGLNRPMEKSLRVLDHEYYDLDHEREAVVPTLLGKMSLWSTA